MAPLRINPDQYRYQALLGVGGIGVGRVFALNGNHTLGREESRAGHFLPNRDYCKLHIIAHYVKTLLGSRFAVIPIGKVGNDAMGRQLLVEMNQAGLDTRYVELCEDAPTMHSICFVYPDGTGGNLTTDDSACTFVDAAYIAAAKTEFAKYMGSGIALAAPEVSLESRQKLLQLGTAHRFYRVASFLSAEVQTALLKGMLNEVDLLALNIDEAAAAVGLVAGSSLPESLATAAVEKLSQINPTMRISITAGRKGSWAWEGTSLNYGPAFEVKAVSTAGAGDAHLAGMIAGLTAGLAIRHAQELALLTAAMSVTSPHTIHPELKRETLLAFADELGAPLSDEVRGMLAEEGSVHV